MRKDFARAAKEGSIIKTQNYITDRGAYQILFVRYRDNIYFYKHLNGKLVECCNLSTASVD